jgi:flagellar hook protein FlgE
MIGALWTGISGLSSQQKALDNESNNIANVNTIGYKASRISFADQMYQDRIGKGSKILDAEKLYTQGSLKLTGVNYDMALSGDGFFTVLNTRSSGSAETLYTRAGNFRMGDNGTLQDSAGNEVQGWPMTAIDNQNDVTSTNPNVKVFNTDYSKLLGSKVIKHDSYVETITAKATDYNSTVKSDSSTVFSGAGLKTKQSKIADIEAAITDYTTWLQKLKDEPDGLSATSISQISEINFKTGSSGIISKDGDQVYAYINGNK